MISGVTARTAATSALHSRGFMPPSAARGITSLAMASSCSRSSAGIADRIHHEVVAAGAREALHLLGALLGRADHPVLAGERAEVLRVAPRQDPHPRPLGALVVAAHRDERQVRGHEAVQAAARLLGGLPDLGQALGIALGLDDVGHPAVALPSGPLERRVGAPAHPDRRPRPLHRLRVDAHPLELREAPLERGGRVPPQRPHHVDALGDARPALAVGNPAGLELLRVLTAHPDPEDQAAPAEHVERGR